MSKGSHDSPRTPWMEERTAKELKFRADLEARIKELENRIKAYKPVTHGDHEIEVSFASNKFSQHWFTLRMEWVVLHRLLDFAIPVKNKDSIIICPGPLRGGKSVEGTRKTKENVEGLHLLILDFDKGDAPLDLLETRMKQLDLESAAHVSFSHLKETTLLPWSATKHDDQPPTQLAFQTFVQKRLGLAPGATVDVAQITNELAKSYMVEESKFDEGILGEVSMPAMEFVKKTTKGVEIANFEVKHQPIAKSRLVIPLAKPYLKIEGETAKSFQDRWEQDVYLPIGKLIGFNFDATCASIERGHYALTRREGTDKVPVKWIRGSRLLDLEDPELLELLKPHRGPKATSGRKSSSSRNRSGPRGSEARMDGWQGFKAADAAADTLPDFTDKRNDADHPLVAFPCPFVHEHATSNDPSAHQCYAYNASCADQVPTVKCQSATCKERPYVDFLDRLFVEEVRTDSRYRVPAGEATETGRSVPVEEVDKLLEEINQSWAIVRIGGRTKCLHESADGEFEIFDKKSMSEWFANWLWYQVDEQGNTIAKGPVSQKWFTWNYRRQYRDFVFCPHPNGTDPDVYNSYYGFSVEPKRGSWQLLKGHIYRNICQRNPEYFAFFMAWLAQLVQQPHIKPGTNIVLKGAEGTGKSKVGEWIVKLFGRNAIVVSEAGRITGRFNGHLENKLFLMAEEAFWAGDKAAEGKLKDLATGTDISYERKGLDAYEGKNYTRIMIASNEDWVVPAASGGRRWFVLEVGDEHQKDHAYFAAIDNEMENGGLAAMLYDLQRTDLPSKVNVRSAPVTPWLVKQRLHSYDNRKRWWRGVISDGGFRDPETNDFTPLSESDFTEIRHDNVYACASRYFAGPKGVPPSMSEIGIFLKDQIGEMKQKKRRNGDTRYWSYMFPPLSELREQWLKETGEPIRHTKDENDDVSETNGWPGHDGFNPSVVDVSELPSMRTRH